MIILLKRRKRSSLRKDADEDNSLLRRLVEVVRSLVGIVSNGDVSNRVQTDHLKHDGQRGSLFRRRSELNYEIGTLKECRWDSRLDLRQEHTRV